jgi:hypothetical protein
MGDPEKTQSVATYRGAAELIPALGQLRAFSQTTHMNGQSTVVVHGDRAVGETYCFAHQIYEKDGKRTLQILAFRYYDDFLRPGGSLALRAPETHHRLERNSPAGGLNATVRSWRIELNLIANPSPFALSANSASGISRPPGAIPKLMLALIVVLEVSDDGQKHNRKH